MNDAKFALKFGFDTKVKLLILLSEENRLLGMVVMAVDSICNVVNDVKFWKEDGTDPAGTVPSPITCNDCIVRILPNSAGKAVGTPGNVNVREFRTPEPLQEAPFHVQ